MSIKSLLLGSAAALAVVSGANAADAIVAAEPEPAEYVKVCDIAGAGYFYIPGSETCLKIGGYVRYQVDFGTDVNSTAAGEQNWVSNTKADLTIASRSETDLGTIASSFELNASSGGNFALDNAWFSVGGFKAGYYAGFWDNGIGENPSWNAAAKFNSVGYSFNNDAFEAGVQFDQLGAADNNEQTKFGIEGLVSAAAGPAAFKGIFAYDTDASEGAVKGIISAEVGPGTLDLAGMYSTGKNTYTGGVEWAYGAAYAFKVSDKLTIAPDYQYVSNLDGTTSWIVGALTSYSVAPGFDAKLNVNYNDKDTVGGWLRLQRSF